MTKAIRFALAAFAGLALASSGCSSSSDSSSAGGGKSSASSSGSAGSGGSSSKRSSGGSASSGGKSSASSSSSGGSSSGGSTTSEAACGSENGTYQENTTFSTSGATAPYTLNKWGTWGNETEPSLTQTTTAPDGLDCSSGCAALTIDFSNGTKQYSAGSLVQFFGTSADSVTNLLNETITVKVALEVKPASDASKDVPISVSLFGQDPTTSSNGVDNLWIHDLGSASSLAAASGWHTVTFKVVDAKVPSWSPTRTVCASGLHALGITIQNNNTIDEGNGGVITLYLQSVTVGDGSSGSGGSGGSTGGSGGSDGGQTGSSSGGTTAGGATSSSTGAGQGGTSSAGATGTGSGGAAGGSTSGLPRLQASGTKLQDPSGKTIILRGSSLLDIGTLYVSGGKSAKGITDRIDKLAAAGVQGHVIRLPVYPRNNVNAGFPFYSELPYPVGANAPNNKANSGNTVIDMTAEDYIAKVLKPAVDYATGKNLYVIIDFHQIDDATKGETAADANTFWTTVAPAFANYANVIYEAFNEPIDLSSTWSALKPVAQGWIDTIRKGAPDTVIIVPSPSYCQRPGDAASDPPKDPKSNLMFTAHPYPGNWKDAFKAQVATAVTKAPVFFTEWGYVLNGSDANLGTSNASWGSDFQTVVDGNGGSWTAWVTDNNWTPNMFSDGEISQLTDFGKLVKSWLAAKADSDWVQ